VEKAIRPDTAIISIMYANNEVGTIEPIAEIGEIARAHKIPFHTDAVQAGGALSLDVKALNVDMMSLSAHKFYGPKGVGVLYARRGVTFLPMQTGGGHERNRRAGTENVPYIVGLATALKLAYEELEESNARITRLRDRLIAGVLGRIPDSQLSGHPGHRLPNNASFLFKYIEGESILLNLDQMGVAASSGSACTSGSLEPSHVLTAMGFPHEVAHGSPRLSLGKENTDQDVDYVLEILPGIVDKLRRMSPLFNA
jgi:cysteine desulfurase